MVSRHTACWALRSVVLVAGIVAGEARAAVAFTILDLGTLGGASSTINGPTPLNASGQVVGRSDTAAGRTHAFRTEPNAPISPAADLGTLDNGASSIGFGVNASGQVVGWSSRASGGLHAFRTAPNGTVTAATDLGTLGGSDSFAYGINASGQVVGNAAPPGNSTLHPYRTTPGGVIDAASDLGGFGGRQGVARGVNDSGQAVGSSETPAFLNHAFRTAPNGKITAATDLGTLGGPTSQASAINASGQTVGLADLTATVFHAFRTTATGAITPGTDLGTLGGSTSIAFSINTIGQVVGNSLTTADVATHAFFVDATGPMLDLNTMIPAGSGWTLTTAQGINDLGQIAGVGTINGQTHAFLLTPAPEPAGLAVVGFAAVLAQRRVRRNVGGRRACVACSKA